MTSPLAGHRDGSFAQNDRGNDPVFTSGGSGVTPSRQRQSFLNRIRRASKATSWRDIQDDELASPAASERPAIPSALPPSGEATNTPLPVLPMIVLSIVMLGEFLSANVATPFLLFMVEGFGIFTDEADVGFWTGILVSCFFITQFLTSLLWATAAEKHGTRSVIFVSLLGSSLTCFAFGTATTLPQAMCIRLLQGIFAGAIGVGRGNIAAITDPSNEGRAYAILGFAWGFGGVAGAIIGGIFENPATKWDVFQTVPLFVHYPYLLPTMIAASVTFIGAMLSLLLARDGGPREGAIRLHQEKPLNAQTIPEEPSTPIEGNGNGRRTVVDTLKTSVSRKLSGYFAKRVHDHLDEASPTNSPPVPLTASPRPSNSRGSRSFSRTAGVDGSAYGYGRTPKNRLASNVSQSLAGRRGSLASTIARRRRSTVHGAEIENPEQSTNTPGLNFAQRLLMANENAVTNIADLWVAAAINADNEDVFLSESENGDDFSDEEDEEDESPTRLRNSARSLTGSSLAPHTRRDSNALRYGSPRRPHRLSINQSMDANEGVRRLSSIPAIFSHTGVRTSSMAEPALPSPRALQPRESEDIEAGPRDTLVPIMEHQTQSRFHQETPTPEEPPLESISEKQPSTFSLLPMMVILQYGLLALHTTTHDQVFLSYLNSKYQAGGLNLNAGHFAQLIALMCLAQIAYQFYLYPNMGPPRGRFSHLAMFRIGSLLFIPAYLTVTLYRPLASADEDGNALLMTALVVSTALRYAGITFAYTAIAILLNYMSPPHILGFANGIAQSIVSFARFLGPIIGGYLWSVSVDGNPSGYPIGFIVCSAVTAVAVAMSFFIR